MQRAADGSLVRRQSDAEALRGAVHVTTKAVRLANEQRCGCGINPPTSDRASGITPPANVPIGEDTDCNDVEAAEVGTHGTRYRGDHLADSLQVS
jgi:hypothetical protein